MLGPLLDAWNFVRRPLPAINMTVVPPSSARLSTSTRNVQIEQGGSATVEFEATNLPEKASLQLLDLPQGLQYKISGRDDIKTKLLLQADLKAAPGTYEISAEADLGDRRVPSAPIILTVRAIE